MVRISAFSGAITFDVPVLAESGIQPGIQCPSTGSHPDFAGGETGQVVLPGGGWSAGLVLGDVVSIYPDDVVGLSVVGGGHFLRVNVVVDA